MNTDTMITALAVLRQVAARCAIIWAHCHRCHAYIQGDRQHEVDGASFCQDCIAIVVHNKLNNNNDN